MAVTGKMSQVITLPPFQGSAPTHSNDKCPNPALVCPNHASVGSFSMWLFTGPLCSPHRAFPLGPASLQGHAKLVVIGCILLLCWLAYIVLHL
jgi:hypothetical protein